MEQTMKLMSWNVNGLRAVIRKEVFVPFVQKYQPDILCLQETKAKQGQAEIDLAEYEEYWNSAERNGYAGTAIFAKTKPLSITNDIPGLNFEDFTDMFGNTLIEGRVITLEYPNFYLVTVYTPNAKRSLERLMYRQKVWDPAFLNYMKDLEHKKPVICCGDFNVAHQAIDLARPKDNRRNAGFTDEEREGANNIIKAGFIDSFRHFYPEKTGAYTWWSNFNQARDRNIGWRIDYFFVSPRLLSNLKTAEIHSEVMGSDHCPIEISIEI